MMKRRTGLMVILTVVLLVGAMPNVGNTICIQTGQVLYAVPSGGGTHTVVIKPLWNVLNTYVYTFTINNDDMQYLNAALHANSTGKPVYVLGNAVDCPATGENRDGGLVFAIYTLTN